MLSWILLYYIGSKIGNYCGISEAVVLELSINAGNKVCKSAEAMALVFKWSLLAY